MDEGDYLMMDPACEVNEKGTREKNDGNKVVEEGTDTPLNLDPNEVIEADDETLTICVRVYMLVNFNDIC